MAVLSITESFLDGSNTASWTLEDSKLSHTYSRALIVVTDTHATLAHQVLSASGIPAVGGWPKFVAIPSLGSVYFSGVSAEVDNFSIASSLAAERIGQSLAWKVTIGYSTWNPAFNNLDPTANDPKVSWSYARYEEVIDQDIYGEAILNTAFDPFDPPVTRDANRPILKVSRTEQYFDHQWAGDLKDTLNSDAFAGYDVGMWKVSDISAADRYDPLQGQLWDVDYEFELNMNGWDKNVLSIGFRQLTGTGTSAVILDDSGAPITTPALLDASGHVIPPGPSASAAAVTLGWVVYESVAYGTTFNFGTNINFGTPSGVTLPTIPITPPTVPVDPAPSGPDNPPTPISPSNPEA